MKVLLFGLLLFFTSTSFSQNIESWKRPFYVDSLKWEIEYEFKSRGGKLKTSSKISSTTTGSTKFHYRLYEDFGKFSTLERFIITDKGTEVKDGELIYFDKFENIRSIYYYENGEEKLTFIYLYYPQKIPMIKATLKHNSIWNIIEYYLPNGTEYNDYGDFENGVGQLNFLYFLKEDSPENYPTAYEYYFTSSGKQKRRRIRK